MTNILLRVGLLKLFLKWCLFMRKKTSGVIFMVMSTIAFMIDRFSHVISNTLGRLFCGNKYLQPVNGVFGDPSCGFNADMYLTAFLFAIFVVGLVVLITSQNV